MPADPAFDASVATEPAAPPDRYFVQEEPDGRFLYCREAPEVRVRIAFGATTTAASARKAPPGTIYLDGAAQGGPFLDAERRVFNLDHHEGCVRSFTLSTCEQALVLVLRGLDVKERTWTLYANDPDLDTVIAIWVLLNGQHLASAHDQRLREAVIPLVRIEGILDIHGPERVALAGLPQPVLDAGLDRIAQLRDREVALRRSGGWEQADLAEFTADQLRDLDAMLYPPGYFLGFRHVEVITRAPLGEHRVVVVCRADGGIYEGEAELKRLYGKRLGVIVLQKDERTYTLRQVDPFLPANLDTVYARLNLLDPAVRSPTGSNRWGGSAEIGGSPRESGTRLAPHELAEICQEALHRPTSHQRGWAMAAAVGLPLLTLANLLVNPVARLLAAGRPTTGALGAIELPPLLTVFASVLLALLVMALVGPRWHRRCGLRLPTGNDWWLTLPAALLGAAAGGVWVVPGFASGTFDRTLVAVALGAPLAAELTFRGLAHGLLARVYPVQQPAGRWFLSSPTLLAALLYALWTPIALLSFGALGPTADARSVASIVAGALLVGITNGVVRERSGSVVAPILLHWLGVAGVVTLGTLLASGP